MGKVVGLAERAEKLGVLPARLEPPHDEPTFEVFPADKTQGTFYIMFNFFCMAKTLHGPFRDSELVVALRLAEKRLARAQAVWGKRTEKQTEKANEKQAVKKGTTNGVSA